VAIYWRGYRGDDFCRDHESFEALKSGKNMSIWEFFHLISDFFTFMGWFFQNATLILKLIFLPFQFAYNFLSQFIVSLFAAPIAPTDFALPGSNFLSVIPFLPQMSIVLGVILLFFIAIFVFRRFERI
jgi:hypothetical protein